MAVIWPEESNAFPTGDAALHLVCAYGDVSGGWDGTQEDIANADWYVVDGIGDYTRSNQAPTQNHPMFGRVRAVVTVGASDGAITLNGWFCEGDGGQELLRSAQTSKVAIGYMNIRDRSVGDGYAVVVKVGGGDESQNAEGGLQPTSFSLAPQADEIEVTSFNTDES